jgi:threonine/homoserine/homoserine lactone efflux protein
VLIQLLTVDRDILHKRSRRPLARPFQCCAPNDRSLSIFGNLLLLWLAALPLMGSPGPATMSLAAMGAAFGIRRSISYLSGIVMGTFAVLIMIATGVTGLILARPDLVVLITFIAATYILYLAYRIATAPVLAKDIERTKSPAFIGGFLLALANPKAFAAIGAVYSGNTVLKDSALFDAAAKTLALSVVIVCVNTAWLVFGSTFSTILTDARKARIANMAFAVMLVVSVVIAWVLS